MKEFKYLGSLIEAHGKMTGEVNYRIAQASKVLVSFQFCVSGLQFGS